MKKNLLFLIFIFIISQIAYSGVKEEHDAWFEQIIIGGVLHEESTIHRDNKKYTTTTYYYQKTDRLEKLKQEAPDEYEKIKLIEDALTLSIDQFNNNNRPLYNSLKLRLGNTDLLPPFEKINFETLWWNHEKPTHNGWDKWRNAPPFQARKKLLQGVTKEVFPTADKKTQNELCRFFCSVHVLGDIFGNIAPKSKNKATGEERGSQVASNTRLNIEGVINELWICLPIIIDDYEEIIIDLNQINIQAKHLLGKSSLEKIDEVKYFKYIRLAGYKENNYRTGFITYKSITEQNTDTIQNLLYSEFSRKIAQMDYFKESFPVLSAMINE